MSGLGASTSWHVNRVLRDCVTELATVTLHILDMMQRDGIIGPPDGSKPREVLKCPDWLHEVENQLR